MIEEVAPCQPAQSGAVIAQRHTVDELQGPWLATPVCEHCRVLQPSHVCSAHSALGTMVLRFQVACNLQPAAKVHLLLASV